MDTDFLQQRRKFGLHNASSQEMEMQYCGETVWIPAKDSTTIKPQVGVEAYYDESGRQVPGAVMLFDRYSKTPGGEDELVWSAGNAIKHWLGLDSTGTIANGPYYKRGFSLLPVNGDLNKISVSVTDGLKRAEMFAVKAAQAVVAEQDQLNLLRQRAGSAPLPGGERYQDALAVLLAFADKQKAMAKRALSVQIPDEEPAKPVANLEFEMEHLARAKAAEVATKTLEDQGKAPTLKDVGKLSDQLMSDPSFRERVNKRVGKTK